MSQSTFFEKMHNNILSGANAREVKSGAAFTLIEMLVVVGIIVVDTGTMLANNSKFGGVVLLQNLAYDMALSTREAQVYGVSVKRFGSGAGSNFSAPFGIHYETGANNKVYRIFADAKGTPNGIYDDATELVQSTSITRGYYIGDLCVKDTAGTETCGKNSLDITYKHPEPDAYIYANGSNIVQYQSARIVVMSPRGDMMSIIAEFNGQISVHLTNQN